MGQTRSDGRRSRLASWIAYRRGVLGAVAFVAAVIVVLGLWVAFDITRVSSDVKTARVLLVQASANVEQAKLGEARNQLVQARQLLTRASERLYNRPQFEMASWLPGIHQNLAALRDGVANAIVLVNGGSRILSIIQPLETQSGKLEIPLKAGTLPIDVIRRVDQEVEDLATQLKDASEERKSGLLLGPVRELQHTVYRESSHRRQQLNGVHRALSLLQNLAGGNRRYLLAVANTAEMRGSGGMILSYGILKSNNGTFTLGEFGNIDELSMDAVGAVDPASLNLPSDFVNRWSGLAPTLLWRNTNLAPDFSASAPVMAAMYEKRTGDRVDGVVQLDPAGLAALLVGSGPVNVPGLGLVTSDNVVDVTLNKAYVQFPDRDTRQEVLATVAETTFATLLAGNLDSLRPLGDALYKAGLERHIVFWSDLGDSEAQAAAFGATGPMPTADTQDYAVLTVQNFSKNKLDYYVDSALALKGTRPVGKPGSLTATVTLTNTAPPDAVNPAYVFGPNFKDQQRGVYRGLVSLYLPTGTTLASADGGPTTVPPTLTTELGRTLVTFSVDLPAGRSIAVTLHLATPPRSPVAPYSIALAPIPRVRPTSVHVDVDAGGGVLRYGPAPLSVATNVTPK